MLMNCFNTTQRADGKFDGKLSDPFLSVSVRLSPSFSLSIRHSFSFFFIFIFLSLFFLLFLCAPCFTTTRSPAHPPPYPNPLYRRNLAQQQFHTSCPQRRLFIIYLFLLEFGLTGRRIGVSGGHCGSDPQSQRPLSAALTNKCEIYGLLALLFYLSATRHKICRPTDVLNQPNSPHLPQ